MAPGRLQSLDKALNVIELLTTHGPELGVSEIAAGTSMDPSTVHRILTTLVARNFATQNPATRKYRLGLRFLECAASVESSLGYREVARDFMKDLADSTMETVNLSVRDRHELVYIDQVQPNAQTMIQLFTQIGARAPLHCTGAGKALLATLPDQQLDELLDSELKRFTDNTVTNLGELKAEIARIRSRGFAIDDEERERGVRCVATVIWDSDNQATAALSVSGPTVRISRQDLFRIADQVRKAAEDISRALGWRGNPYFPTVSN